MVRETIIQFANAADNKNIEALEKILDANFRIAMNQLFGSKEVTILPKAGYLQKIQSGALGGSTRKVTIHKVMLNGNTAVALITYSGQNLSFTSLSSLIKNAQNEWVMLSEMPVVQ